MAKVEKNLLPDSTGLGSTEVTTVAHEVYPLKPNENKTKEYKSNEELQRDRFRAFEAAKEDAWVPDRDSVPEEVVTTYKKVISDNSESYVNRFRTPKKSVKLFVALRLVRKNAKYRGAMRLSDLEIIASRALEKYNELLASAGGLPVTPITKNEDIKTFIETELDSYNNGGKKEPVVAGGAPTPVLPGPAASNIPGPRPIPAGSPVRPIPSGMNLGGSALGGGGASGERAASPAGAGLDRAAGPELAAATATPSPAAAAPVEAVTEEEINNATAPDPAELAELPPPTVPRVEPPTGKYAAYNTEVHLTEKPDKTYFVKADDYNSYEFGLEVTGYDPKKKKLTKLKKLQLHAVYTHQVDDSNLGTVYIKPSDLGNYNSSGKVYGWDGTRSEPQLVYITDHL
nr:MAG TPA: hypothetical protein [Caudoviricetes sp.]